MAQASTAVKKISCSGVSLSSRSDALPEGPYRNLWGRMELHRNFFQQRRLCHLSNRRKSRAMFWLPCRLTRERRQVAKMIGLTWFFLLYTKVFFPRTTQTFASDSTRTSVIHFSASTTEISNHSTPAPILLRLASSLLWITPSMWPFSGNVAATSM